MFGNTIAKRVKKAINHKIEVAERHYATICRQIDRDSAEKVKEIYIKQEQDKMDIAESLVKGIIG